MYTVYNKHSEYNLDVNITECTLTLCNKNSEYNLDVNITECTLYTINIQSAILM